MKESMTLAQWALLCVSLNCFAWQHKIPATNRIVATSEGPPPSNGRVIL
jgi:hypothetical protein